MDGTVLVADDDRTIRTVLTQALTRAGCKVHATSSLTTLMRWVAEGKGDVVISGRRYAGRKRVGNAAQDRGRPTRFAGHCYLGPEHNLDGNSGGWRLMPTTTCPNPSICPI